ncbi:MAG: hypothetical protein CM15mP17_16180 [Gammaproteobacteria bacterium]|nr:MAG: hypothetical protein CM15mP17_16180 [Gammaproteobacteria bacterium]
MLFEREALKDLSLISLKKNNVIFNLGDKYDYPQRCTKIVEGCLKKPEKRI